MKMQEQRKKKKNEVNLNKKSFNELVNYMNVFLDDLHANNDKNFREMFPKASELFFHIENSIRKALGANKGYKSFSRIAELIEKIYKLISDSQKNFDTDKDNLFKQLSADLKELLQKLDAYEDMLGDDVISNSLKKEMLKKSDDEKEVPTLFDLGNNENFLKEIIASIKHDSEDLKNYIEKNGKHIDDIKTVKKDFVNKISAVFDYKPDVKAKENEIKEKKKKKSESLKQYVLKYMSQANFEDVELEVQENALLNFDDKKTDDKQVEETMMFLMKMLNYIYKFDLKQRRRAGGNTYGKDKFENKFYDNYQELQNYNDINDIDVVDRLCDQEFSEAVMLNELGEFYKDKSSNAIKTYKDMMVTHENLFDKAYESIKDFQDSINFYMNFFDIKNLGGTEANNDDTIGIKNMNRLTKLIYLLIDVFSQNDKLKEEFLQQVEKSTTKKFAGTHKNNKVFKALLQVAYALNYLINSDSYSKKIHQFYNDLIKNSSEVPTSNNIMKKSDSSETKKVVKISNNN